MERGMLGSPAITYLRLDLYAATKRGGPISETPVLSVLIRGVIVEDQAREWRSWDFAKDSAKVSSNWLHVRVVCAPAKKDFGFYR